jgi:predicted nucleic acid-binding protein
VTLAYLDSSCLVAIAFDEPEASRMARRLRQHERLFSSNLLEAELRSALIREGIRDAADPLLTWITWVYPNRPLTAEFQRVTAAGYLKGADLWHLANALFLSPDGRDLAFLTLDARQREVASALGFAT